MNQPTVVTIDRWSLRQVLLYSYHLIILHHCIVLFPDHYLHSQNGRIKGYRPEQNGGMKLGRVQDYYIMHIHLKVFHRRPSGTDTEFFLQLFVEKSEKPCLQ